MPFFLRKSMKFGPFRFNFSKSGIGISGGVKGARVGVRPDGRAYHHVGRHGLYHRGEHGQTGADLTWFGKKKRQPKTQYFSIKTDGIRAHLKIELVDEGELRSVEKQSKDHVEAHYKKNPDEYAEMVEEGGEEAANNHVQRYYKATLCKLLSHDSDRYWDAVFSKDDTFDITDEVFVEVYDYYPNLNLSLSFNV